jgi:hypothetical protein
VRSWRRKGRFYGIRRAVALQRLAGRFRASARVERGYHQMAAHREVRGQRRACTALLAAGVGDVRFLGIAMLADSGARGARRRRGAAVTDRSVLFVSTHASRSLLEACSSSASCTLLRVLRDAGSVVRPRGAVSVDARQAATAKAEADASVAVTADC